MKRLSLLFGLCALGCANVPRAPTEPSPGTTHIATKAVPPQEAPQEAPPAATLPTSEPTQAATPASSVAFELKNSGADDLVFAVDKGWQPVIFAYSGQPPTAKSVLLFPTACTTACDAAEGERCPRCDAETDPVKVKQKERAETKREVAPANGSVNVPWDGKILVYEKTKSGKRKCKCWKKSEPPAGEYTVKACGLRPSREAGKHSTPVCAEKRVTLPATGTITLDFAP